MPRPVKHRRVEYVPEVTYFKPAGVPMRELDEVTITLEELESIRLKDLDGLEQEDCAEKMHVSRPTFQRVLIGARNKVAKALVEGKAIRVEGGNYKLATHDVLCNKCGESFTMSRRYGQRRGACNACGSKDLSFR